MLTHTVRVALYQIFDDNPLLARSGKGRYGRAAPFLMLFLFLRWRLCRQRKNKKIFCADEAIRTFVTPTQTRRSFKI
jgi:hypothetical protein